MAPRRTLKEALSPTPEYCLGRKPLCDRLQDTPYGEGATFLFGGILTGKTTLLLKVQSNLLNEAKARLKTSEVVIPVYADLRLLPDTQSSSLFHSLLSNLQSACQEVFPGFSCPPRDGGQPPLDVRSFAARIDQIFTPTEVASFRVLFLLDNCERLRSLPSGLQANLVWLLWGDGDFRHRNKISMIMAGGQQMRSLLIDPTTVMATRAAQEYIFNLSPDDVLEMVKHCGPAADAKLIARELYAATGGHAGLTRTLLVELTDLEKASDLAAAVEKVAAEKEESFRRIKDGLSAEAASIQELLSAGSPVTGHQVETRLQSSGLDRFKRPLCLRELRFSGIAVGDNAQIRPAGQMYWKFYAEYASHPAAITHPSEEKQFIFKKDGAGWLLAFNGAPLGNWRHPKGLQRIHRLLKKPRNQIDVIELAQDGELAGDDLAKNKAIYGELQEGQLDQPSSGQPRVRTRSPKQLSIALSKLNQTIRELEEEYQESTDRDDKDTLEERINKLKGQHQRIQEELESLDLGRSKSAYNAVRKSIFSESIPEIGERLPGMAKHLKEAIKPEGYTYRYTPDPAIDWLLL